MKGKKSDSDSDFIERRSTCRIDDEVLLSFRVHRAGDGERAGKGGASLLDASSDAFTVFAGVAYQRERARGLLRDLRSESPKISRYMVALEERMQFLENALLLTQAGAFSDRRHWVTLSAGGISFRTESLISPETVLQLKIVLLPNLVGIASRGRVVRSVRQLGREGELPYLTAVEFIDMKESTRDLISRHVLARQISRSCR